MNARVVMIGMLAPVALMTAACTADSEKRTDPVEGPAGKASDASPVQVAWRKDLDVIGQPEVVGDTAVVIARVRHDELDVVGVSTETGKIRWRRPFHPGSVSEGYGIDPPVVQSKDGPSRVVMQQAPVRIGRALAESSPVYVIAPRTGQILAQSPDLEVYSPWGRCTAAAGACAEARLTDPYGEFRTSVVRLDLRDGDVRPRDGGMPFGAREIGPDGLFATDDRPGEQIGRVVRGRTLWTRPVAELFGRHRSTDGGWSFEHDRRAGRYVGQLRTVPTEAELDVAQG